MRRARGQESAAAFAPNVPADVNEPARPFMSGDRPIVLLAAGISLLTLFWLLLALVRRPIPFAVLSPEANIGVESAAAFARLFGALVLLLVPVEREGRRLRWVAAGLAVLGVGGLVFGYLQAVVSTSWNLNRSTYESILVRTLASALFAIGLVSARPPALTRRVAALIATLSVSLSAIVVAATPVLPALLKPISLAAAAAQTSGALPGLTAWHWGLSAISVGLTIAALTGAFWRFQEHAVGGWLLLAMVLLAGSQLHNMPWPSTYSPLLTTGDILRLGFAAIIVLGGILELRSIAAERAVLLTAERAHSQRLAELARLKEDFTRMVIHELSSPVAAIRGFSMMLASGKLGPAEQIEALSTIQSQTDILARLVGDVESTTSLERDDFVLQVRPTPVSGLLADAAAYARALPGIHPVITAPNEDAAVWADRARIGQVLSNLLDNAAKYCPPGTRVEIRAGSIAGRVCIDVSDEGPGIPPEETAYIFEKFARSGQNPRRDVPGLGLGLYISNQIVQAHGSRLGVQSKPGKGSTFSFDLEIVR